MDQVAKSVKISQAESMLLSAKAYEANARVLDEFMQKAGKISYAAPDTNGRELEETILRKAKELPKKKKNIDYRPAILAGVAAIAAICIFVIQPWKKESGSFADAQVYDYYVCSYGNIGMLKSQSSISSTRAGDDLYQMDQAFSILSFIRSDEEGGTRVERVQTEVIEFEEDLSPVLDSDASIKDNLLRYWAVNDGWGNAENVPVKFTVTMNDEPMDFSDLFEDGYQLPETVSIEAGQVIYMGEAQFSPDRYEAYLEKHPEAEGKSFVLNCGLGGKEPSMIFAVKYDRSSRRFSPSLGGKGDMNPQITLYWFLDTEELRNIELPAVYTYTGEDSTPIVENNLRIETAIIPDRSCTITCRNLFQINGEEQETGLMHVHVTVPRFRIGSFGYHSSITRKLENLETPLQNEIDAITGQYYYDPQSIVNN